MSSIQYTKEQAAEIISNSSLNGWYALYAFSLSFEKNIAFDRVDFPKKTSLVPSEYFYGYLVACYSLNVIKFNIKDTILTPTYFDSVIKESLKLLIFKYAETHPDVKEGLLKIDQYFAHN